MVLAKQANLNGQIPLSHIFFFLHFLSHALTLLDTHLKCIQFHRAKMHHLLCPSQHFFHQWSPLNLTITLTLMAYHPIQLITISLKLSQTNNSTNITRHHDNDEHQLLHQWHTIFLHAICQHDQVYKYLLGHR